MIALIKIGGASEPHPGLKPQFGLSSPHTHLSCPKTAQKFRCSQGGGGEGGRACYLNEITVGLGLVLVLSALSEPWDPPPIGGRLRVRRIENTSKLAL